MVDPEKAKECPACERINPASAETCDCGFSWRIQAGDQVVGILGRPFFIRNGMLQAPLRYRVVFTLTRLAELAPVTVRNLLWLVFKPVLFLLVLLGGPILWLVHRPARHTRQRNLSQAFEAHRAAGLAAYAHDNRDEAEARFRAALEAVLARSSLGLDFELVDILNDLAGLHSKNGVFALLARAIEDSRSTESTLGRRHPKLADKFGHLGNFYAGVGGRVRGTSGGYWSGCGFHLQQQAFDIRKRAFGTNHLLVAESFEILASMYTNDWSDNSGPAYRRALEIKQRLLGPDHPDVAMALDNCAGYASDSEDLFRRALSIRQNAFGLRHPSIALSMENLAQLPGRKDRVGDTERLLKDALAIREEIQGPGHPDAAATLGLLGDFYSEIGRFDEADKAYLRAIEIRMYAVGIDHRDWHDAQEILELQIGDEGSEFALFERVAITEDHAHKFKLTTKASSDEAQAGAVGLLERTPLFVNDVLAYPGKARRAWSTALADLQHAVEDYASSVGRRESSRVAHQRLEELAGPLDFGIVEGGWSEAFRQLKEEIQQATSGI